MFLRIYEKINYICINLPQKSSNIMESPVTTLKVKCAQAGTNLTEVCRRAGIARSTVDRWERNVPKSFQIYHQLLQVIEQISNEKTAPAS